MDEHDDRQSIWSIPPDWGWLYFTLFAILTVGIAGYSSWVAVVGEENPWDVPVAMGRNMAPWVIVNAGVSLIFTNLVDWGYHQPGEWRLKLGP